MEMNNEALVKALAKDYYKPIPIDISTPDAMKVAGTRLAVGDHEPVCAPYSSSCRS